jgi:hypothetical protein
MVFVPVFQIFKSEDKKRGISGLQI